LNLIVTLELFCPIYSCKIVGQDMHKMADIVPGTNSDTLYLYTITLHRPTIEKVAEILILALLNCAADGLDI